MNKKNQSAQSISNGNAQPVSAGNNRRSAPERRFGSERRRNAEVRTPVIQIGHSMLRLAIVIDRTDDERPLILTRSIRWRNNAKNLFDDQGATELREALRTLATEERLSGTRVRVLLNSDLCVTRAVTGVTDEVQREVALLRERSQFYLSLGSGRKVVASSSTPLDARHSHALLTVATEQTLQVVLQAILSAGMEVDVIESAQVAIARVVGLLENDENEAAIVVQVGQGGIELGVMRHGRLFLDYRPGGHTHVDHLADLLSQHLTRLKRYCQRHHGLKGAEIHRVYVCGDRVDAEKAINNLESLEGVKVEMLDLESLEFPWEFRDQEVGPELAGVLGSALVLVDASVSPGPNLVDQLQRNARPPLRKILVPKLAPLAAMLLIGAVVGMLNWQAKHRIASLQNELAVHAPIAARADVLWKSIVEADRELQQLDVLHHQITPAPLAMLARNVSASLPSEVWLTGLQVSGGTSATIVGNSFAESSIYDFVGNLQHLPGVADVALESTGLARTNRGSATTFNLSLDLSMKQPVSKNGEAM